MVSHQSEPEDHAGAGEAQSGAREAQIHRPGEEPQAARAHVRSSHCSTRAAVFPLDDAFQFHRHVAAHSGVVCLFGVYCWFFLLLRVMQDRREQARQDLKGLEETVVSSSKSTGVFVASDRRALSLWRCDVTPTRGNAKMKKSL